MIEIYIPKSYSIIGDPSLTATLSSLQTYKSAQVIGTKALSASGFVCAYGEGASLLTNAVCSSVKQKLNAWIGINDNQANAVLNGRVIHLAPCAKYEFPDLENNAWSPLEFNEQVKYHNNMSGTGEFIGRSIVRSGRTVSVTPLSFNAPIGKMNELETIKKAMQKAPFYVKMLAPNGAVYCVYGWTEDEPTINYLPDYGQVSFSFKMRSTN